LPGAGLTSVKQGDRQIEYEDKDRRIHRKFIKALRKNGITSEMGDVFDEDFIMSLPDSELTGLISTPQLKGPAI
jgi:hypothetical protein